MISFPDALNLLLENAPPLAAERVDLDIAAGRVLRQEVRADRPFPPFDRVMMDGYALRLADWRMGTREYHLTGTAPAGQPAGAVDPAPGTCVEVMTGAPLPAGADGVVPVEDTSVPAHRMVRIAAGTDFVSGQHIHRAGSDAKEGDMVLAPGVLLDSRHVGAAASCGASQLTVSRLPRIAVFATGDELVAVDQIPLSHQIRQSNAHAIRAALQRAGYPVATTATLGDEPEDAAVRLQAALSGCEWLILTGAVSKGARDFIPGMLDRLGCRRLFHGIAQRPGKPAGCWLGPAGQVIAALPGNPVSALTGLHALVIPALAAASGLIPSSRRHVAPEKPLKRLADFTHHLPVLLQDELARPAPAGNSGDFIGLLRSDGFVTLPPAAEPASAFPFTPWI